MKKIHSTPLKNNELLEKAIDEYIDEVRVMWIREKEYDLNPYILESMKYAGKFFTENYDYTLETYKHNIQYKGKTKNSLKKYYYNIFDQINYSLSFLLRVNIGEDIHKKSSTNPSKFGLLSKWVDWYYLDDIIPINDTETMEEEHMENIAVINPRGEKIITDWEKYIINKGLGINERLR